MSTLLIVLILVGLALGGMALMVDAGHGEQNSISRATTCVNRIDAGNPFAAQLAQAGSCVVGSVGQ